MEKRRQHQQGFTLVELMVVVAIIAILVTAIGVSMARSDNATAVTNLTQRIYTSVRQARNTAVNAGAIVRMIIPTDGRSITVERASLLGAGPPPGSTWIKLRAINAGGPAKVQAIRPTAEVSINQVPGNGGLPATIIFNPDGSATASTIYVRGESSSSSTKHKVVIYGITGTAQRLTRW